MSEAAVDTFAAWSSAGAASLRREGAHRLGGAAGSGESGMKDAGSARISAAEEERVGGFPISVDVGASDSESDGDRGFDDKTLKMVGFKALLAWHYLVLFSPLFIGQSLAGSSSFLYLRQFVLYLSLAASFGLLTLVGRPLLKRSKGLGPSRAAISIVGGVSTVATVLPLVIVSHQEWAQLLMTAFLGVTEALFMFLWLHYYRKMGARHLHRSFGFDMMCGGALAFVVCNLTPPAGSITAVFLPVIAAVSLIMNWHAAESRPVIDEGAIPSTRIWLGVGKGSRRNMMRQILKTLIPVVVYSFVFGLIQGGYLVDDVTLLMANDALVLLGVVAAGLVICLIPERSESDVDIDLMHRFSLIFFVFGVVGIAMLNAGNGVLVLSEAAILAGFNLFDFGSLILGIGLVRRMQPDLRLPIDGARPLVYVGLATGLLVGNQVVSWVGGAHSDLALLSVCGVAVTMLVVTVVMPLRENVGCRYFSTCALIENGLDPREALMEDALIEDMSASRAAAYAAQGVDVGQLDALAEVVKRHGEGALPCLEADDGMCPALTDGEDKAEGASPLVAMCPRCGTAQGEGAAAQPAPQAPPAAPVPPETAPPLPDKKARVRARLEARAESEKHDSPWRRTCREVAKLYRLSPRETEIFFLIAKGRNAEFVQQKLVISMHTAKTHIANIYHKLGVHSSQEMLSLVEAFREEDIKARRAAGESRDER